jgi:hypothetical protein
MGRFIGLPFQCKTSDGRNFELTASFTYLTDAGEQVVVPIGALSDGASTPPEVWNLIPPFGVYWPAAYMHDFLYRCTQRTKAECDALFDEAMKTLGTNPLVRLAIYHAVALAGQDAFDRDRKAQAAVGAPAAAVPPIK